VHAQAVLLEVVRREREVGQALEALVGCAIDGDSPSLTRLGILLEDEGGSSARPMPPAEALRSFHAMHGAPITRQSWSS
jgi:hypothetical protein